MTKAIDLRGKSDDELKDMQKLLSKEQFNLRFQKATGQLANPARARVVRHDLARIATVLNERRRGSKTAKTA